MASGTDPADSGFALVVLALSALVGLLVAGLGSFAIVVAGTAVPSEPVNKPLITYDTP
ncbi:MAG TPA: hypothetical protein VK640_04665 [Actinomycetes bacterium]|jgi:hypothetical protein|nr:hypothetical protein [Actinomycetes bacterium]